MNKRALVLPAVTATLLLVLTPAALASPRHTDTDRHHHATSWSDLNRGSRSDLHRDGVWRNFDSRDDSNDDSDSSDDGSDGADESDTGDSTTDTGTGVAAPEAGTQAVAGGSGGILTGTEQRVTFRITGFGAKDNTPAGSLEISQGVIHKEAGGDGSFQNPLTAASPGSAGSTESPKGMRFYVPHISRYVIIEDSGASKFSQPHLDIWSGTTANVEDCEGKITGTFEVIRNPKAGYPVKVGPIATGSGCNI